MSARNAQNRFKVKVADTVISVKSKHKNLRLRIPPNYKPFITEDRPEIEIEVCKQSVPGYYLKEMMFDSGTTWTLYCYNGKRIIRTPSAQNLSSMHQIAILESDFQTGKIYIPQHQRRRLSGRKAPGHVHTAHVFSYPFGEILMINLLSQGRGMMVHACGITEDGQGILFIGSSGAGKSTMANLWKRKKGAVILSDDRIIVRKKKGKFWIYGTPWHGDAKVYSPERAPLKKIFFLKHAENNSIKKISPADAVSRLIVCSFPPFWDKKGMGFTLKFCAELAQKINCYELGFVPDETVLDFVRNV